MKTLIIIIGSLSLLLGVLSGVNYLRHPLAGTSYASYTGGKFWIVTLICIIVLYLKGA